MSNRTKIGEYHANKGTFVLNNIGFSNGVGDGTYGVYIDKSQYDRKKHGEHVCWFDFRDTANIHGFNYHPDDCDESTQEIVLDMDCMAAVLYFENGNAIFRKYF